MLDYQTPAERIIVNALTFASLGEWSDQIRLHGLAIHRFDTKPLT